MSLNAQQLIPLPGNPQNWGTKQVQNAELVGPAIGGAGVQTVTAAQVGWGGFDLIECTGLSYSGTYFCKVQYLPVSVAPSGSNQSVKSVQIQWFVTATGAAAGAVDLSGEIVRLFMVSN